MVNFNVLFLWAFFVWVGAAVVWLLPKKFKLMKRVGMLSNEELYQLAKNGDDEALRLKKHTTIFLVVGAIVLVPLRILSK